MCLCVDGGNGLLVKIGTTLLVIMVVMVKMVMIVILTLVMMALEVVMSFVMKKRVVLIVYGKDEG